ncbi:DUF502 domain-containing protein [Mangrovibacterium marinum]|uniref:Putative membrane protein n=1 Tax=Mangrovibacterium marinum TaxID=1639118 RepID=A0A2T5C1M6_9BACT|nr:DUF502 domain-containing protein [Mangrovibacterium marinum]PTN08566.1 putative membrane protein [Mangrovibacterium marinum]
MKRFVTYFMQGLLLVAPIALTIYFIWFAFDLIDGFLRRLLESWLGHIVPGVGILILFLLLTLLGFVGQYIVLNPVKKLWEGILRRTPLLKLIYGSLVDLFTAFVGKEKKFNTPVMVCLNKENNQWRMGFLTQPNLDELDMPGMVAVYFPHSYAFSGQLYMVEASAVKKLDMPPAEAMKFVVSGGVTRVN